MSFPSTIQAITISKTGGIDVIEKTSQPFPQRKPSHVLIKVEYLGINFIDTYYRQGLYPLASFPATLGKEASGRIVDLPTDKSTLEDKDYLKRGYQKGGKVAVDFLGAHAEYISVPWKSVYPVPEPVSSLLAAATLLQAITAVSFMTESYEVKAGDVVLVHTVAGGLGLLFAQYAKYKGATVIGTTSTQEKADLARANGADHVILYPIEDTVQRVLEITEGQGVDAIFDGVGKDTFDNNFKMIKRKGTIVSVGNASGAVPPFSPLKLVEKNVKLLRPTMSNYTYTPEEARHYGSQVFDLVSNGTLKVRVHKEYPFTAEGVQQAQSDLAWGKTTGKLVVKVSE